MRLYNFPSDHEPRIRCYEDDIDANPIPGGGWFRLPYVLQGQAQRPEDGDLPWLEVVILVAVPEYGCRSCPSLIRICKVSDASVSH
jgi:hypothetical protein